MVRTELVNVAHDAVVGACVTVGGVVSVVDFVEDFKNSNLLQPDRIGIEVFGVIAAIVLTRLAAKHFERDLSDLLYGPPSEVESAK
jgi:hypothetical protein